MRIIRHPKKKNIKGAVVALGTFDGVHLGHQKIIKSAVRYAQRSGAAALAITFDPHPQQLIVPQRGLKLLTTLKEREELFCRLGIDGVVVINFNRYLQRLSSADFVRKFLVKKLGVSRVFVGFDYAFGRGRSGNVSHLEKLGKKYGFGVSVVPAVSADHGTIKSRLIRELVGRGDFKKALVLLGHPYQITGRVVKGSGRGRELGFPTANLKMDKHKLLPAQGVYFGHVNGRKCLVNIGARPTFGPGETTVEVYLLNFHRNLKGKVIAATLTRRLREERQFSDVEALKDQIRRDLRTAKRLYR